MLLFFWTLSIDSSKFEDIWSFLAGSVNRRTRNCVIYAYLKNPRWRMEQEKDVSETTITAQADINDEKKSRS